MELLFMKIYPAIHPSAFTENKLNIPELLMWIWSLCR